MALDRAHLGNPGGLETGDTVQPGPGRQDDVVRGEAAAVRQDELGTSSEPGDRGPLESDARARAGLHEGTEQGAVVDLVVARDLHATTDRRAQRGDELPALRGAAAARLEPERMVVGEQVVQSGTVRGIERNRDRPGRDVAELPARLSFELLGESGPAPGALEEQGRERRFAELRLGDRGEHSRCDPGRAATTRLRCNQRHRMTIA